MVEVTGQLTLDDLRVDPLADAIGWRNANPLAYEQIIVWACIDQDNKVRPSIDLYFNILRRPHFARMLGISRIDAPVLLNNNLRSQVARLIAREHPRFADKKLGFEFRRSTSDMWGTVNAAY